MKTNVKLFLISLLFQILSFLKPQTALALAEFSTDYQIDYQVLTNGLTHVKYDINQINNFSQIFATDFSLSLNHTNITNIKITDIDQNIHPEIISTNNITNINFTFINKIVGKDKTHHFTIEYDTQDIATKNGSVWEINIPKMESKEDIKKITISLTVPEDFPQPAYIDPKPSHIQNNNKYTFSSLSLANRAISALFGQEQFYRFRLYYHLQNDHYSSVQKEIALPPNTNYQTVFIKEIKPSPDNVKEDVDHNWLATYTLKPYQQQQVYLEAIIKLNFSPQPQTIENSSLYTQPNSTWDYQSSIFHTIPTENLKSAKTIYDYVSQTLTYNYSRIQNQIKRPGATFALQQPSQSICTEFTDLFIALARKNNLPAREIQGFALSTNDKLRPLSLSRDVLHSWPEYYNFHQKTWIQIDPTWANTTNGIDYFNKLDLNHIAFVIHGQDPHYPLPAGSYKNPDTTSKDIYVEVIDPLQFPLPKPQITTQDQKGSILPVIVTNDSGIALNSELIVKYSDFSKQTFPLSLPPFSHQNLDVDIKSQPFYGQSGQQITLLLDNTYLNIPVTINPLITNKHLVIGSVPVLIFMLFIIKRKFKS